MERSFNFKENNTELQSTSEDEMNGSHSYKKEFNLEFIEGDENFLFEIKIDNFEILKEKFLFLKKKYFDLKNFTKKLIFNLEDNEFELENLKKKERQNSMQEKYNYDNKNKNSNLFERENSKRFTFSSGIRKNK